MSVGKQRQGASQPKGQWITKERRLGLYIRDGFACQYCGTDLKNAIPADLTLDHLTPRSEGGDNKSENLVLACRSCNSSRGAKVWTEFAPGGAIERIQRQRYIAVNLTLSKAIISGEAGDADLEAVR